MTPRGLLAGLSVVLVASSLACSGKKAAPAPTPQPPQPAAKAAPAPPPRDLAMKVDVTPPKAPEPPKPPPPPPADPCKVLRGQLETAMVHFDHDRATINASAASEVNTISSTIKSSGLTNAGVLYSIEGHCDATGSDGYNVALSDRRAQSVLERLVALGAITTSQSKTMSWGKQQPLDPAETPEAYAKNRRVEIKLQCPGE